MCTNRYAWLARPRQMCCKTLTIELVTGPLKPMDGNAPSKHPKLHGAVTSLGKVANQADEACLACCGHPIQNTTLFLLHSPVGLVSFVESPLYYLVMRRSFRQLPTQFSRVMIPPSFSIRQFSLDYAFVMAPVL